MKTEIQTYTTLLRHIKQRVTQAQQRAFFSANEEMLRMYWDVDEMLTGSQMEDGWGQKTLERLSVDLKNEFPKIKGFSVRNMQFMMQFYEEYNKELTLPKCNTPGITKLPISQLNKNTETDKYPITQSAISQLPTYNFELPVKHLSWTHNLVLIQKVKDVRARYWYIYALRDIIKPIGISDYELGQVLPDDFSGSLPTIEEMESEFEDSGNKEDEE